MDKLKAREDELPDYEDNEYEETAYRRSAIRGDGNFTRRPISAVNGEEPVVKRRRLELQMPPTFSDDDVSRLRSALNRSEAQSRVLFQRIKMLECDRDSAVADHDALLKKRVEAPPAEFHLELVERNRALEIEVERYRDKVQVANTILKNHESWEKEVQRSRRELKPALDQARIHLRHMLETQAMWEKKCAEKDRVAQQLDARWSNANHLLRRAAREFMEPNNGASESSEKSVMGSSSSLVISALAEDAVHHGLERVDLILKSILGQVKTLEQINSGLTQSLKKQTDRANTLESILNRRMLAARSQTHVSTQCDVVPSGSDDGPKNGDTEEQIAHAVHMDIDNPVAIDRIDTAVSLLTHMDVTKATEVTDEAARANNMEQEAVSKLHRSENATEGNTMEREAGSKLNRSENAAEGNTMEREAGNKLPSSEDVAEGNTMEREAESKLPSSEDVAEGNTMEREAESKLPSSEDAAEGNTVEREAESKLPSSENAAEGNTMGREAGSKLPSSEHTAGGNTMEQEAESKLSSSEDVAEGNTAEREARSKLPGSEDAAEGNTMEWEAGSGLPRDDGAAVAMDVDEETMTRLHSAKNEGVQTLSTAAAWIRMPADEKAQEEHSDNGQRDAANGAMDDQALEPSRRLRARKKISPAASRRSPSEGAPSGGAPSEPRAPSEQRALSECMYAEKYATQTGEEETKGTERKDEYNIANGAEKMDETESGEAATRDEDKVVNGAARKDGDQEVCEAETRDADKVVNGAARKDGNQEVREAATRDEDKVVNGAARKDGDQEVREAATRDEDKVVNGDARKDGDQEVRGAARIDEDKVVNGAARKDGDQEVRGVARIDEAEKVSGAVLQSGANGAAKMGENDGAAIIDGDREISGAVIQSGANGAAKMDKNKEGNGATEKGEDKQEDDAVIQIQGEASGAKTTECQEAGDAVKKDEVDDAAKSVDDMQRRNRIAQEPHCTT